MRQALFTRELSPAGMRRLGSGSYGTVYSYASQRGTLAIKLSDAESEAVAQLRNEFRQGRKLTHPVFVRHDRLETYTDRRGRPHAFLSMEFVAEPSLRSALRRLTLGELAAVAEQVGQAAIFAMDHKVVLIDLNIDNVRVGQENQIRIIDFGLYDSLTDDTLIRLWEGLDWQRRYVNSWLKRNRSGGEPKYRSSDEIRSWSQTINRKVQKLANFLEDNTGSKDLCLGSVREAQRNLTQSLWQLAREQEQVESVA